MTYLNEKCKDQSKILPVNDLVPYSGTVPMELPTNITTL
jgi:hypothetical protein